MRQEALFCFDAATVRFAIYPDGLEGARVIAQISEDPLRDLFGAQGGGDTLVQAYACNAEKIDAKALAQYRAEPSRPVCLQTVDFSLDSGPQRAAASLPVREVPWVGNSRAAGNEAPFPIAA